MNGLRQRPTLSTADTLDRAPRLSGTISENGVANLDVFKANGVNSSQVHVVSGTTSETASRPGSVTDEDVENYDTQEIDPSALVPSALDNDLDYSTSKNAKRKSIPITLEKTDKRGRYMLHAEDREIRDILRKGLERQALNSKRKGIRDLVFTRRFTQFDRQNPSNSESPFHGFFTLFWLSMAILLLRVGAANWKMHGSILGQNEVIQMMFNREVFVLAATDAVMFASGLVCLPLQQALAAGWIHWETTGWLIQTVWQLFFVTFFIGWTFFRHWPFSHTIFLVLHTLVFLMKQHSYAFYNGYLSQVYRRKIVLKRKLEQLKSITPVSSPSQSSSDSSFQDLLRPSSPKSIDASRLRHRRRSSNTKNTANMSTEPDEITSVASAISSGKPINSEQRSAFSQIITSELSALTEELKGKCNLTQNDYPSNLTFTNFADWSVLPTLVYELEYPRQDRINWWYVAEKGFATIGVIGVMMAVSQAYIFPPIYETLRMKEAGMSVQERWEQVPWIVGDMLFPLLLEQLLAWYVIWECLLNVVAEVTGFADRGFYGDWWNSVSWDQYARDWNRPVHNFLLRHVYHSSISALHLSKGSATFVTFLLSAVVHELVMFCMFKKVRGYLFTMQLLQVPLVAFSRTNALKGRQMLGNTIFWIGLFVGPSFLTSLYLVI